jgi:hypothetical protein
MQLDPIFTVSWMNNSLIIVIGPVLLLLILIIIVIYLIVNRKLFYWKRWKCVNMNISIGSIGSISLQPNNDIAQVAHAAWSELITRKAAIPFDEENDVIIEVFNSWYELFKEYRRLIKIIPPNEIRDNKNARTLEEILIKALNNGLRPVLTKWQARLRKWVSENQENYKYLSPQDLEKQFPLYKDLISDIRRVNEQLIEFSQVLNLIAHGEGGKNV